MHYSYSLINLQDSKEFNIVVKKALRYAEGNVMNFYKIWVESYHDVNMRDGDGGEMVYFSCYFANFEVFLLPFGASA